MATVRLAPQAILSLVNQTGPILYINEDPDAPDGLWLTVTDTTLATEAYVSFPSPGGDVTDSQEIRARVRKVGGANNPTARLEVWESGAPIWVGPNVSITSTTGQVISFGWTGGLSDITGAGVEVKVVGVASGGSPSKRATVELGAIEWNAVYTVSVPSKFGSVGISGGGAVAASGIAGRLASVAISGGGSPAAVGSSARAGAVSISAGGVVTATASTLLQVFGSAIVSGGGAVAALGRKGARTLVSVASGGAVNAAGRKAGYGGTALSAGGSVAASGRAGRIGHPALTGGGAVSSIGRSQRIGSAAISGGGAVLAIGYRVGAQVISKFRTATLMGVGR